MSKSLGNILDPIEIIKNFGVDQLRYYLTKEVSLGNDGNISLDSLTDCINNDLANNYGNLCQRVFSFVSKNCDSKIPPFNKFESQDQKLSSEIIDELPKLKELMDNQDLNLYIKQVIQFSFNANKYFNDQEPWNLKKSNPERMNAVLYNILNQIRSITILLYPVIPESASKVLDILGVEKKERNLKSIENSKFFKSGRIIKKSDILFKKIENDN